MYPFSQWLPTQMWFIVVWNIVYGPEFRSLYRLVFLSSWVAIPHRSTHIGLSSNASTYTPMSGKGYGGLTSLLQVGTAPGISPH